MTKINVAIVDDEPLAREIIKGYLSTDLEINIVGECENGFECIKLLSNTPVDLLFLDIQMPKIDGFELLEILEQKPEIIFCTAFDNYAIKAFEKNAIDYLLKPFSRERFEEALFKAKKRITNKDSKIYSSTLPIENKIIERIIIRTGSKILLIPVDDIYYIESDDDYVLIHSKSGRHIKDQTMKYFESHLPAKNFIRVHRGFIANIDYIKSIEAYSKDSYMALMENGEKIKISPDGYRKIKENS
jgi:two-component system LytT family response regulator